MAVEFLIVEIDWERGLEETEIGGERWWGKTEIEPRSRRSG